MGARRVTQAQIDHYWVLRAQGWSIRRSAKECGFSQSKGEELERGRRTDGQGYREARNNQKISDVPIPLDDVCDEAKAALADRTGFLFMKRYFGIELEPWQQRAWEAEEDAWDSRDREYLLENGPPGGGKTTQKVGFVCKRVVLNRAIRCLFISRAQSLAERNTMRCRRALERTSPAVGADSTLSLDFGRFKPKQGGEVWKRDEFVVEQMDGSPIEEKEPTVSAFGFDSEWLGNRLELVVGDDLDSTRSTRNLDVVERNREIFDNELEPRLEPGGLFIVTQQRLGAFDFSAHCLSKLVRPDDDGADDEAPEGTAQYKHLVFKAHYDELCRGRESHRYDAPAWPDGCLLAPQRLGWRDVRKAMNNPARFKVVYQQEDPGEDEALVKRIWVDGGRGSDGVDYLGCWDRQRGAWQLPRRVDGTIALDGPIKGYITVDPSPTKYWSCQGWAHHPASDQRFLIDLVRDKMEAPDFLDWSHELGDFTGLADDWWKAFNRLGVQLTHIIVERNGAQRFMLQYDHFKRWMRHRGVLIVPHDTAANKADPDYGVQTIAGVWKHGKVRLPYLGEGRIASLRLVDEVTRYPHSATTDCVMGQWFLEYNLPRLTPQGTRFRVSRRPSWMAA